MALLAKLDLKYKYDWTASAENDNPKITGEPDSTLFSRHEGYEVLYLINKFAEIYGLKNKVSGHKIEEMIRSHLPSDLRSQINVKSWIKQNWDKY